MKHRPEYDKELIGRNLKRCRLNKNLSVEQVREYLQIGSMQAVYKWEAGKGYPQTDTMFALMELYEIGLHDLLLENTSAECLPVSDTIENAKNTDPDCGCTQNCDTIEIHLEYESQKDYLQRKKESCKGRLKVYVENLNHGAA